eukprot:s52_g26.t1
MFNNVRNVSEIRELVLPNSGLWKMVALTVACLVAMAILRVVLARPGRRGSVVWVVAVLTLAATCPTFVGSPYRLSLHQAAKGTSLSEHLADFADQFKTASVAGAVAFLMNCGIQGVAADPSTLSNAYATSPGGVAAPMEQRVSHATAHAPLNYQGVQQQLVMKDFDVQSRHVHQVSANVDAHALQAANDQTAGYSNANVEAPSAVKQVETEEEAQLEALEGRIKEEKLRLSEAAEQLKTLEEDLQAAKVKRAMQEAAGMDLSTDVATADEGWGGFRDLLLLGFGAVLGAVGHGLAKLKEEWSPPKMPTMPTMPSMPEPSTVATSGALGLAFSASVYSTAPALTLPTPVYPAALPLLTMRKAVPVPESEVSSPSSSPMWGERPFLLQ